MGKRSIKAGKIEGSARIRTPPDPKNHDAMPPIFSLEKIQDGEFSFPKLEREDKAMFAEAIFRRRKTTWAELKSAPRTQIGFEKINRKSIKAGMPDFITEDREDLLAFRYNGKKSRVGLA